MADTQPSATVNGPGPPARRAPMLAVLDLFDAFILAGAISIVIGIALWSRPAAFIAAGVFMLAVGVLGAMRGGAAHVMPRREKP